MTLTHPAAPVDPREAARARVLRAFGAGPAETDELLAYNRSVFAVPASVELPLADEPCVDAWRRYADEARTRGVLPVLREHLVELRFPVAAGIRDTEPYQAAIRRGVLPDGTDGLALENPNGLRLFIHPTPAGAVPVLVVPHRGDFEALVRALTKRNEPVPLPPSMGACMVGGYNNWGRVADLRGAWERGEVPLEGAETWSAAFGVLRNRKELYQDRFVLLSGGPYSGVPAEALGLTAEEWSRASLTIRLEHECAHYFTRRVLSSMRNNLLDELLADYAGIVAAAGRYRADWFLRFCGLEEADGCRPGGRLENYRGDPPLSDAAFTVLGRLVRAAARRVEAYDATLDPGARTAEGRGRVLMALARRTLEEIAAGDVGRPHPLT
ncbi:DUF7005 family protein [Longimicrobium sp.]|uniref:DUF7005 family protein n=1 Tax=Longimicrobium sp. TaxID=2029185 RepID=UPI002E34BB16|nr:hypothetical protein [Longimicrobium sp.]HEX6037838.1 hypothetical protein [Longimicrobium sp.]